MDKGKLNSTLQLLALGVAAGMYLTFEWHVITRFMDGVLIAWFSVLVNIVLAFLNGYMITQNRIIGNRYRELGRNLVFLPHVDRMACAMALRYAAESMEADARANRPDMLAGELTKIMEHTQRYHALAARLTAETKS